jgi:small subunit ribosomal protein S21
LRVEVRNGNMERAIRLLKRKLTDEGVFKEIQERKFYEKPSDKKRRLKRGAISRQQRADRERDTAS